MTFKYIEYKDSKDLSGHAQILRMEAYEKVLIHHQVPKDKIDSVMERLSIPSNRTKLLCVFSTKIDGHPFHTAERNHPDIGKYYMSLFLLIRKNGTTVRPPKLPRTKAWVSSL